MGDISYKSRDEIGIMTMLEENRVKFIVSVAISVRGMLRDMEGSFSH